MGDRYLWISPDGTELELPTHDPKEGTGMVPVALSDRETIGGAGSVLENVRHGPRTVDLAVTFRDRTGGPDAVRDDLRIAARALDPLRGDGRLRRIRPSGSARELVCRYAGGLELEENDPAWQPAVLTFRAFDPYWLDEAYTVEAYTTGAGFPTFLPGPPFTLSGGTVWATPTLDNGGDAPAWPVWTIVGPANGLEVRNVTTGEELVLSTVLAVGETITIDTRPGAKTVRDAAGSNLYGDLGAGSRLFALDPGANVLDLELIGASDDSSVSVAYRARYLTA